MTIRSALRRISFKILQPISCFLDIVVPKSNLIVVFSENHEQFNDNAEILLSHLIQTRPMYKYVVLVSSPHRQKLLSRKFPSVLVLQRLSLNGLYHLTVARHAFITCGIQDFFPFWPSARTNVYQLGHAIMAKAFGLIDNKYSLSQHQTIVAESRMYHSTFVSSDVDRYFTSSCLGSDIRKVHVTGLPRQDHLLSAYDPKAIQQKPSVILYAPTYRDSGYTRFLPFNDLDIPSLALFLRSSGLQLYVRPHPLQVFADFDETIFRSYGDVIVDASAEVYPFIQDLLPLVSFVISDYSSIFIDLLPVNVPCLFIKQDDNHFSESRGFAYPASLLQCGPTLRSQSDMINCLSDYLNGDDAHHLHRQLLQSVFYKHNDGLNCERIATLTVDA